MNVVALPQIPTTPASAVSLDIFSSTATYAITLCAGSQMRFRKLS